MAKRLLKLSDFSFQKRSFPNVERVIAPFTKKAFLEKNSVIKSHQINATLLKLIQKEKEPCFLLGGVLDYIDRIHRKKILPNYLFSSFELWLNQYSNLDFTENLKIRAKIVGKYLPRDEYQNFFPIGMKKIFFGSHFVTAHISPDLDSTIGSFWGWMDAFAAHVGSGVHLWNVPGGPPTQIEMKMLFSDVFGEGVFTHLLRTRSILSVTSSDLITQEGVEEKKLSEKAALLDPERRNKAIIIVDDEGYYLGDWRSIDVEAVRQVIMLLNNCFRWFINSLQLQLISSFAKKKLLAKDIKNSLIKIFSIPIQKAQPAKEMSDHQKNYLHDYLQKVLLLEKGQEGTFEDLAKALKKEGVEEILSVYKEIEKIGKSHLFDKKGILIEDRALIFNFLENITKELQNALLQIQIFMEKIDVAMHIKTKVFGYTPHFVTLGAGFDEMKKKMGPHQYLTVVQTEKEKMIPIGVIRAEDLRAETLGTVSFRDFCNFDEMNVASNLEVISVVDHHKTQLQTLSPPTAIVSDAQSSNTLIAEKTLSLNEKYSLLNMDKASISRQIEKHEKKKTPKGNRLLQNLLQKKEILEKKDPFFITPQREFLEYLQFLYGILDDTDLLTKVSYRDVQVVATLLNRMRSIMDRQEEEIIHLEDIQKDEDFSKKAASRILQNPDMYSLYKKVYKSREKAAEENIISCATNHNMTFFSDTKKQNQCCRVGQTKLFISNWPILKKHIDILRKKFVQKAYEVHQEQSEIDFHLHMISTIRSADEVYSGKSATYTHKDQIWGWIPASSTAIEHLKDFLSSFEKVLLPYQDKVEVEFFGPHAPMLQQLFKDSFFEIPTKIVHVKKGKFPSFVLYYPAGEINSRKGKVSPFLPKLIS